MKTEPAYQLLREQLRDEIAAGHYRDGARLPTESELVARHGLSRQTVRRAFQDLVAEGVVYRVPGRGTYATDPGRRYLRQLGSIEDLMSLSDDTTMEVLAGLRRRVDVDAASRLRLDDDIVYTVVFRRLHDGVPFVLTTVHLVPSVAQPVLASFELADGAVGTHTVIGLLEPHLAEPIAEAAQSITVAAADAVVAEAVGSEPGHAMLRVDRLYSDMSGRPVELSVSHFLPEQYTYRVTLRRSG
jgi:DNA-binding GntR family transcriptional regulator